MDELVNEFAGDSYRARSSVLQMIEILGKMMEDGEVSPIGAAHLFAAGEVATCCLALLDRAESLMQKGLES